MPMSEWSEVVGRKCDECKVNPATHLYGSAYLCCQCHGGNLYTPEEAQAEHDKAQFHKDIVKEHVK
jgi:hypothetical protein